MVDAPSEERLDFFNNLGRQASCFGFQHPGQIHASAPLDFAAKHRISVASSRKLKLRLTHLTNFEQIRQSLSRLTMPRYPVYR
jgi:hypothetical protein